MWATADIQIPHYRSAIVGSFAVSALPNDSVSLVTGHKEHFLSPLTKNGWPARE